MKTARTYWAQIFVGLREGYGQVLHDQREAEELLREFVNGIGLCVTVTRTRYIYVDGSEPGIIVGLINYPRFPSTPEQIREKALAIGEMLRTAMGQNRVTVQFPDETVMLEAE